MELRGLLREPGTGALRTILAVGELPAFWLEQVETEVRGGPPEVLEL